MKGKDLQERRVKMKLSREELARELKTTSVTIWRWENDERAIPPYLELAIETIERKLHKKS